jgi:membrane protein required for colicin V production
MNILDILLIAVILLFAIHGFIKGLIHEMASLAGLILGIYASFHFAGLLEGYIIDYLNILEKYSFVVAFILVFIAVVILVHFIAKLIENMIDIVALGLLNKIAGSVFGIIKAIVFLSLAMLLVNHFDTEVFSKEKKDDSFLYKPIESVAPLLWEGFEKYGRDKLPVDSKTQKKDTVTIPESAKKDKALATKSRKHKESRRLLV